MPVARLEPVTRALVAISATLLVVGPVARYADYLRQRDRAQVEEPAAWARMFDLSTEANIPTWWSSTLLAGLALLFVVAGRLHALAGGTSRPFAVLAAVAGLLSIDEAVALHEQLLGAVGDAVLDGDGLLHFTWVVPGAVVAVAVGIVVLRASASLPPPVRRRLVLAGAVFLAGAIGVESISGAVLESRGHDRWYLLATTVEEGLELAGTLLAITAARRLVRVIAVDPAAAGGSGAAVTAPHIGVTAAHPAAG